MKRQFFFYTVILIANIALLGQSTSGVTNTDNTTGTKDTLISGCIERAENPLIIEFTYDGAGNRNTRKVTTDIPPMIEFTYDATGNRVSRAVPTQMPYLRSGIITSAADPLRLKKPEESIIHPEK